jgi:cellulose synthase/poly-beta-1,6-N-acetylglucosamine synthase-like glycosyltransferase
LRLEVNATQRLLESVTGHRTTLFRPPYAIDGEPQTAAELRPLFLTSQLGYYTVNESIDPNDWQPGKQASRIASEVLAGAAHGGHIILLHDGGGNRSQTVKALPAIIRGLRAQGFEIVSIADLLGVPEDRVMPAVQAPDRLLGRVNQVGYTANDLFQDSIYWLFIASVILGLFRLVGIASLAILQRRAQRPLEASSYHPSVAVLVPAYNEERVILTTVETILDSSYSNLEVIVVDDGSSDSTLDRLAKNFPEMARLQLLTKANGGKAAALNYAIERTKADIIVTIDADTIIDPRAVGLLVPHFSEAGVAAVAGNAKVGNRLNILTRWQALEYIMGQNLDRRAFHRLNCICVVPGAIGAWRREAVIQAGGFRNDTLAEDTDLTLRLLEANWRITYEDAAIAYTEAPDTLETFFKQRFRWVYGTLQAIWKRRHVLLRRRYRALGLVAIPNMLVFQVFLPLLGPIMDILMLASVILTAIQRAQHPESYSSDSVRKIFFYYVFFLLLEIITGITAFLLEKQEDWKLLLWIPVQRFFYRQLLYTTVIRSVLAAVRGSQVHWNKLERKATVRVVANRDVKLN